MPPGKMGPDLEEGGRVSRTSRTGQGVREWSTRGPSWPEVLSWGSWGMSGNQRQGEWDLNDWCVPLLLHLLLFYLKRL